MQLTTDDDAFWRRVEHRMKVTDPTTYAMTTFLLRVGILIVLFTAMYLVLGNILSPAKGYFISSLEMLVHPIMWAVFGVLFIIVGAFLRFRAMGPAIEDVQNDPSAF